MRKIYRPLAVGTMLLALGGCSSEPTRKSGQIEEVTYSQDQVEIYGKPISVSNAYAEATGSLAAVLEVDGKKVLAIHDDALRDRRMQFAEATALIQSEISDGDDEPIKLTGSYKDDGKFYFYRIQANGYDVIFDKN